jgi:transcriptional regulator with XRE-family HTH domain
MATNGMAKIHPLQAYREQQDPPLTQHQLADLLGVSVSAVSRWEAGKRKPDLEVLPMIQRKTGIAPAVLRPDFAKSAKLFEETAA